MRPWKPAERFLPHSGGTGRSYQGINAVWLMSVADEKGTAVVEAGSLQDGRGVVRVFPSKGQTPVPIPQFLMGSKP